MKVLLSIKPEFVSAIFSGEKLYEFRRTIFKKPVNVIIVYASSPVQRVVGEFDVEDIIFDSVSNLWKRTHPHGGIDQDRFFEYFEGREFGFGIQVGKVRQYEEPLCLKDNFGVKPPQSFIYLATQS